MFFFYYYFIGLVCGEIKNLRDKKEVMKAIRTSVMSKQYGNEDFLANLITDACS
jgi:T-complex protein 1 subunit theta